MWSLPRVLYYVLYYTTSVSGASKEEEGGRYHKDSIMFFYYFHFGKWCHMSSWNPSGAVLLVRTQNKTLCPLLKPRRQVVLHAIRGPKGVVIILV